jgi:anti-sigma factor RsiW
MTCVDARRFLQAHVDSELDVATSVDLTGHIKTCATCAAEQKSMNALKSALRQPPLRYEAPDSFHQEVRRMVRTPRKETYSRLFQSLLFWKSLAFGSMAVALFAMMFRPAGISEQDELLNTAVASHVRSLMAEHLTDVASSDQHTVKPWFNGKIDFAPNVTDFAPQGFPLVGGRLDYLKGRPVAALVYRHNKHFINVFVWPESANSAKRSLENRRGYSVINRAMDGLHYCFVSDLNAKELVELANLIER